MEQSIWSDIKNELKNTLDKTEYGLYIEEIKEGASTEHEIELIFLTNFLRRSFSQIYQETVSNIIAAKYHDKKIRLKLSLARQSSVKIAAPPQPFLPGLDDVKPTFKQPTLIPQYTFDNFITGPSNESAFTFSKHIAQLPSSAYNPFLLHGGIGLGKTHLAHAIAHEVLKKNPRAYVIVVQAEVFKNEVSVAAAKNELESFYLKYRNCDILIFDDIHRIGQWRGIQKYFFEIFNLLYNSNKQIIVTSDTPPNKLLTIEERIRSRLGLGLMANITPPDLETREKIIRQKAALHDVELSNEIISLIAKRFKGDLRKPEGVVVSLAARASLMKKEISLRLAEEIIRQLEEDSSSKTLTISDIQKYVAKFYKIQDSDILSDKKRNKEILLPRQVAMFLSRRLTSSSFNEIGEAFGGKNHATVMHSCEKIDDIIKTDADFASQVSSLEKALLNS